MPKKKKDQVTTETVHCYNNIVSIDDVATLEKDYESLTKASTKCNKGSNFNDDAFQEAYQCTYSQWLKVRRENQHLLSRVDALVISNETLECKVQVLETLVAEKESKLKKFHWNWKELKSP